MRYRITYECHDENEIWAKTYEIKAESMSDAVKNVYDSILFGAQETGKRIVSLVVEESKRE